LNVIIINLLMKILACILVVFNIVIRRDIDEHR